MSMNSSLLLAAIFLVGFVIAAYLRRGVSEVVRISLDVAMLCAISALLVYQHISPLLEAVGVPAGADDDFIRRAIAGTWWLIGARLLVGLLRVFLHRDRKTRESRLFSDLIAGAIYLITAFIVLNSVLALPVRGVLATSGILAVVLGLALQNTLSDVFSGIAVGIEAPFRVDDRIMIDGKVEGVVIQVNWRSIRILTDSNDVAIFPNSLVAKAEIINRSFPSARRSGSFEIACARIAAPERVAEVLLEATLLCPDIDREPPPSVVLSHMKRRKNIYRLSFWAASSHALSVSQDHLVRRCRQQLYFAGLLACEESPRDSESCRPVDLRLSDMCVIQEMALFESLSVDQIAQLTGSLQSRLLKPGEELFVEGAADATLYVVVAGILEISRRSALGDAEIVGRIGAGEYLGEISLLTGDPHPATATACSHCRVLQISKDSLSPLIAESPSLTIAFEQDIQRGLQLLGHSSATHGALRSGATAHLLERIRDFFSPARAKRS